MREDFERQLFRFGVLKGVEGDFHTIDLLRFDFIQQDTNLIPLYMQLQCCDQRSGRKLCDFNPVKPR